MILGCRLLQLNLRSLHLVSFTESLSAGDKRVVLKELRGFLAMRWGGDVSLRHWLDKPERSVEEYECLHIFSQIVDIVNIAHSQGIVVNNVRPSCFYMSSFNHVSFIESASCSDSGSDSLEDGLNNNQGLELRDSFSPLLLAISQKQKSAGGSEDFRPVSTNAFSETSCIQSSSACGRVPLAEDNEEDNNRNVGEGERKQQLFPMKEVLLMETGWYTSPEEAAGSTSSLHQIYIGLVCFCLRDVLQSEFLAEPKDKLVEREAALQLRQRIEEQDLLLEFLLLIQLRKQEAADKLQDTVSLLCSDIEEVVKHPSFHGNNVSTAAEKGKEDLLDSDLLLMNPSQTDDFFGLGSRKRCRPGYQTNAEESDDNMEDVQNSSMMPSQAQGSLLFKNSRLMKNIKKLEAAYLLTRCRPLAAVRPLGRSVGRHSQVSSDGRGSVVASERSSISGLQPRAPHVVARQTGWISPFLEGLCKYLSLSKLKVKANVKQGDMLNSSNLVWDASRGQVVTEMREHEKRVWSIDFSSVDPTLLASGSDDGSVKLWSINQAILLFPLVGCEL
ncbi:unnamed protein product [Linum tenue]|uniref:Uncharacterized protein n=1 Tax=Linum tenue TaxID=586396 RepID=A0AAV0LVV3_9ROSI|nr:unnamed protein product [Linum tenue]